MFLQNLQHKSFVIMYIAIETSHPVGIYQNITPIWDLAKDIAQTVGLVVCMYVYSRVRSCGHYTFEL
jgi:hypothetical protein